jgi:alanine dehydrogenase
MTLLLSQTDIEGLLPMRAVIEAVETAHADISRGTALQPAPSVMSFGAAAFLPMAALAQRQQLAVVKLLADIPVNPAAGLPAQRSLVMLVSHETGECKALMHGGLLTRQRTAAASAVASCHLARPDSQILGLVGAGGLAEAHIEAMLEVLPIKEVLVWSRTPATVQRFVERTQARFPGLGLRELGSAREVVENADVVCTLTPSQEPIVLGKWFRPGLHVNAVGAPPRPDHREIDAAGMAMARVFVDSMSTARHESGDLLLAIAEGAIDEDHVVAEIGDVITGKSPGRTAGDNITLFDSVGIAMQDLVIGNLALEAARRTGIGTDFDFSRT